MASLVPHNKVCEFEDFADQEIADTVREVFPHEIKVFTPEFPKGAEYRKYWEIAMAVRALRQYGALRADATLLGVGAGAETTVFFLTNYVDRVVATDLYLNAGDWDESAPWYMLIAPERFAPYPFRADRLVVQNMDGRLLRYPDDTFDGIFSSGSIEHFGDMESIAASAYEMGRVLKPGGVLTLSTEYLINGPAGGDGWSGLRFFSRAALQRYIVEASGLEPVDDLQTNVSPTTLASQRSLRFYGRDMHAAFAKQGKYPRVGEIKWSHYPHLVLTHKGYTYGSVHLALRKTENYPVSPNDWARPSERVIESVRAMEAAAAPSLSGLAHKWVAQRARHAKRLVRVVLHV
jgi:SAM-dependent methyltransferase